MSMELDICRLCSLNQISLSLSHSPPSSSLLMRLPPPRRVPPSSWSRPDADTLLADGVSALWHSSMRTCEYLRCINYLHCQIPALPLSSLHLFRCHLLVLPSSAPTRWLYPRCSRSSSQPLNESAARPLPLPPNPASIDRSTRASRRRGSPLPLLHTGRSLATSRGKFRPLSARPFGW